MSFSKDKIYKFKCCWDLNISVLKCSALENDKSYTSRVFKLDEKLWYSFTLKPNENGAVWIYFNCFSGYEEIKADLNVIAYPINKKMECRFVSSGSQGIELCDHKKLFDSRYNLELHVTCDRVIAVKPFGHNNSFLGKKLFNNGTKDLKIISGDNNDIMVHKSILSTFSPIFAKMIEAQSSNENDAVIEIPDCDFEILKHAIDFCYGISEPLPSDIDEMIKVLKFSTKYEIADLKKEIEIKLMLLITKENICKLSNVAIELNAEALKAVCQSKLCEFIGNNDAKIMTEMKSLDPSFVKTVFENMCIGSSWIDDTSIFKCIIIALLIIFVVFGIFVLVAYLDPNSPMNSMSKRGFPKPRSGGNTWGTRPR